MKKKRYEEGKRVPSKVNLGLTLVTRENLDTYDEEMQRAVRWRINRSEHNTEENQP